MYESTEFIKCLLDSFLNFSIFYTVSNNYALAYKYAYELNEMSYEFAHTTVNISIFEVWFSRISGRWPVEGSLQG